MSKPFKTFKRQDGGQFTSKDSSGDAPGDDRKPSGEFNLAQSLRNLFTTAETAGDFSGAATIARVLQTIDGSGAEASPKVDPDEPALELYTPDELRRSTDHVRGIRAIRREVRARLGRPPLRRSVLDRPEEKRYPDALPKIVGSSNEAIAEILFTVLGPTQYERFLSLLQERGLVDQNGDTV